jgi:hypothetical protein|tara:strand:- start:266 stop:565 length:300 start_codon:yes stop_codon:yes gene_type:complete
MPLHKGEKVIVNGTTEAIIVKQVLFNEPAYRVRTFSKVKTKYVECVIDGKFIMRIPDDDNEKERDGQQDQEKGEAFRAYSPDTESGIQSVYPWMLRNEV